MTATALRKLTLAERERRALENFQLLAERAGKSTPDDGWCRRLAEMKTKELISTT